MGVPRVASRSLQTIPKAALGLSGQALSCPPVDLLPHSTLRPPPTAPSSSTSTRPLPATHSPRCPSHPPCVCPGARALSLFLTRAQLVPPLPFQGTLSPPPPPPAAWNPAPAFIPSAALPCVRHTLATSPFLSSAEAVRRGHWNGSALTRTSQTPPLLACSALTKALVPQTSACSSAHLEERLRQGGVRAGMSSAAPVLNGGASRNGDAPPVGRPDSGSASGAAARAPAIRPSLKPVFAVVQVGSHQFKVTPGDVIYTEKLGSARVNDTLHLHNILLLGSRERTVVGRPLVPQASVVAHVEEQLLDAKVIVFKKKRRKNYRRHQGHRQQLTRLRILDVVGISA